MLAHLKVVSYSHELFGSVDLISINLFYGLLSAVHQLKELGGSKNVLKYRKKTKLQNKISDIFPTLFME